MSSFKEERKVRAAWQEAMKPHPTMQGKRGKPVDELQCAATTSAPGPFPRSALGGRRSQFDVPAPPHPAAEAPRAPLSLPGYVLTLHPSLGEPSRSVRHAAFLDNRPTEL